MDAIKVGAPTLDRPFGIEVWPIFSKCYSTIFGYVPENFRFKSGETFMSTLPATITALVAYYIIIFGGRELMRNRPAFVLNGPFMVHNLYLTIISGGLLALFIEQLLPEVTRNGVFHAICAHEGGWTDKLVILYYVSPEKPCSSSPSLTSHR
jgi:fatty acid elongase 3